MVVFIKDQSGKTIAKKHLTKEELSAYQLYVLNGCIQTHLKKLEPVFIGCYH